MNYAPTILNKPTAAVHIQNSYSATERKLVNICLYEAIKDNYSSEYYTVNVWDVLALLGCDKSKNSTWLKDELFESLRSKPIRWNILQQDNKLEEWTCSFLSGYIAEPSEGKLRFQLNPMAAKQFNNRGIYSRLMLQMQAPIKNSHALTLYEFLNDELHRKKNSKRGISISISDLRALLDIGDSQYPQFKHLNSQAIKPAFEEVNKHTDIQATYRMIREKRRVVSLLIEAIRNDEFQLALGLPLIEYGNENSSNNLGDTTCDNHEMPIIKLLMSKGVSKSKAEALAAKYPTSRVLLNTRYGVQQYKEGKAKQLAPFIVKAIEGGWATLPSAEEERQRQEKAWASYRRDRIAKKFNALPKDDQQRLRDKFKEKALSGLISSFVQTRFKNYGGFEDQAVQREFNDIFLSSLLDSPLETDLSAFSAWWQEEEIEQLTKFA